jgi:hypothetical protein
MAERTYAERLVLVRNAIDDILIAGQSVSLDGRNWTMADLSELRKLELEYQTEAAKEAAAKKGRNRLLYITPVS